MLSNKSAVNNLITSKKIDTNRHVIVLKTCEVVLKSKSKTIICVSTKALVNQHHILRMTCSNIIRA